MIYEFTKRVKLMQKMIKDHQDLNFLLKTMDENQKVHNIIYDKTYYAKMKLRIANIEAKMEKVNTLLSAVEF
jgi:hypothetical protein